MHENRFCSCEPVSVLTGLSLAVAAGGAASSIAGQQGQNSAAKQVQDQNAKAVDDQIIENRKRATQDYLMAVQDEQLQQAQERQALVEKELDLSRTERDANSKAVVAAAESGVSGQSLAAIQADYRFQQDQAAAKLGINQDNANYQHSRNIDAHGVQYRNRATSIQPYQRQPVKPVDYFGPIFGAVGAGLNAGVQTGAFRGASPFDKSLVPPAAGGPIR